MAIYFGQSIDDKLAIADAYYANGNHVSSHDWAQLTDDDKKAGLNQAEREIDRWYGISLESMFSTTDFPVSACPNKRPDLAVLEQAFYILENTVRTKEGSDGAQDIESEEYQDQERTSGVGLSPEAPRCMGIARTQISRG